MTAKKGTGLLMVWADVPADKEDDFNRWYNEEHLAERLAVPGFLSGARYEAVKGGPKHLACYELESAAVLESPAYKRVQANPTAWTKRCSPERHRHDVHPERLHHDPSRSALTPAVAGSRDGAGAPDRAHGACRPEIDAEFNTWYNTIYVPNYEKVPGVIRGRRYRAVDGHADLSHALRVRAPQGLGERRVDWPSATSRR